MTDPAIPERRTPRLIFDIGGVLAEDLGERLFPRIAEELGLSPETAEAERKRLWARYATLPARTRQQLEEYEREHWQSFAEQAGLRFNETFLRQMLRLTEQCIRPVPGMRKLIRDLHHSGVPLAICSNQTAFWARRLTQSLELEEVIPPHRIVFSCDEETRASKRSESGRMFSAVLHSLGEPPPESCWLIDDRWPNLQRAAEFGIRGVFIPPQCGFTCDYLTSLLRQFRLGL